VRELAGCAAAELLAAGVEAQVLPVLRRGRGTRDSAGLGATERRRNLAGRFSVRLPRDSTLPAGTLVLVDDVVTSGATLTEAAAALVRTSPSDDPPVLAAVVAATPRQALRSGTRGPVDQLSGRGRRD
jgi:predicted amidophosphoribosyltransferase